MQKEFNHLTTKQLIKLFNATPVPRTKRGTIPHVYRRYLDRIETELKRRKFLK